MPVPNEKILMFKKLQGAENYKQWNKDMTLALQDTKCWNHIMGFARRPPELKATPGDDDEDRKERIYQCWQLIQDFEQDLRQTTSKISRMCTDTVQKEFLAIKPSNEWEPKELWDWLKKRYTSQSFASKWNALEKLHTIRQSECKSVAEYMSRIKEASDEISDLEITMSEAVLIHALSNLDPTFHYYLAILHHDARETGELPTLDKLTKALEDEELRLLNEKKKEKRKKIGGQQAIVASSKPKKSQTA